MDLLPAGATIGLYYETPAEAPAKAYARFLFEEGHPVALPAFADKSDPDAFPPMERSFRRKRHRRRTIRPATIRGQTPMVEPAVLFVPLVAFTESGERMGQGAAHYDGWLAAHPGTIAIGMAWDVQKVDSLPHRTARRAAERDRHADPAVRALLMRQKPTLRIPLGILALVIVLAALCLGRGLGLAMDRAASRAGANRDLPGSGSRLAAAPAAFPDLDGNRPLGLTLLSQA